MMGVRFYSLLTLLLVAIPGWAQTTTGRLLGRVIDDDGAVLPGASITIASPALIGGAQNKVTDERGEAAFLSLGPGDYRVRVELQGFTSQERGQVKVPLGGAAAITIAMPMSAFGGEIVVVDETPVIDPTQVHSGQVYEQTYMQSSAIGSQNRNYLTVVNQTAGAVGGGSWGGVPQPRVFGSTIGENAYFMDGMDSTDPTMATAVVPLNFDAVAEIQFQTGGFEAEYGRATGGVLNLVTKSGGNRFSGTFDVRYRDNSFQEGGEHFDTDEQDSSFQQYSATLGGPILRDRLWFFASYEMIGEEYTAQDAPTTSASDNRNYLGKITWQINPSWRLAGRYSGSPGEEENANSSRWTTPDATSFSGYDTSVFASELTAVLSDSLLWNSTLGSYRFESEIFPQSGDLQTIGHYNYDTGVLSRNYPNQQYWASQRYDVTTDLAWFVRDFGGPHEIKGGVEYSNIELQDDGLCYTGTPNGERCLEGVAGHFFYDVEVGGTVPLIMVEDIGYSKADFLGNVETVFLQDAWRPTRDVTVKLGLRYDAVTYDNNDGDRIFDDGLLQPRVGLAWDINGKAKNVLRGNWGRYLHPGNLAATSWATTLETSSANWYSCSGAAPLFWGIPIASAEECEATAAALGFSYRLDNEGWDPYGWLLPPGAVFGSQPAVFDPGLKATYADQLILAFERQIANRSSIEVTYVDKKTRNEFNDTCNGNIPTPTEGADCEYMVFANLPFLKRDYEAVMLSFETRGLPWLTMLASYVYSNTKGSVGYTQATGSTADVYPWHFNNRYGYLGEHRRHRLKLNGFFTPGRDWTVAFDANWASPFTWTPYENRADNPAIPYGVNFLEPRGNREASENYQLDLQVAKGFTVSRVRLAVIGSVVNVFSSEQPTSVCGRISGCGEFEMGGPTDWQIPRRWEVGFRIEF